MIHILCNDINIDQQWAYPSLYPYIHSNMRVFVIPLHTSEGYSNELDEWIATYGKGGSVYKKIIRAFRPYHISSNNIHWFHCYQDSRESFQIQLSKADIVVLYGEDGQHMMMTLEDLNLVSLLQQFQGIVLANHAGSNLLMDTYDSTYAWEEEQLEGLHRLHGFALMSDYKEDSGHLARLLRNIEQRGKNVFAFGKDGGVFMEGNHYELLGNSFIVSEQDIDVIYHAYEDAKSREAYYEEDEMW